MIKKEFKVVQKADVLMMASEIVSNDTQIVITYSRPENGKTAVIENNYVFDKSGYFKNTTHWYYKTSSEIRNFTDNYLTLEEMIDEIMVFINEGDFEDEESIRVFIETV